jgi:hypothetical protein
VVVSAVAEVDAGAGIEVSKSDGDADSNGDANAVTLQFYSPSVNKHHSSHVQSIQELTAQTPSPARSATPYTAQTSLDSNIAAAHKKRR